MTCNTGFCCLRRRHHISSLLFWLMLVVRRFGLRRVAARHLAYADISSPSAQAPQASAVCVRRTHAHTYTAGSREHHICDQPKETSLQRRHFTSTHTHTSCAVCGRSHPLGDLASHQVQVSLVCISPVCGLGCARSCCVLFIYLHIIYICSVLVYIHSGGCVFCVCICDDDHQVTFARVLWLCNCLVRRSIWRCYINRTSRIDTIAQ